MKDLDLTKHYSKELAGIFCRFLDDDNWKYSFNEELGVIQMSVTLKGRLKRINYVVDIKEDEVLVMAISPVNAEKDDRECMDNIARFLHRANYGLKSGCFEMDLRDGEIRYRIHIDCHDQIPSREVIRRSVIIPGLMFEKYSSGLTAILFGGVSDEDAIRMCE